MLSVQVRPQASYQTLWFSVNRMTALGTISPVACMGRIGQNRTDRSRLVTAEVMRVLIGEVAFKPFSRKRWGSICGRFQHTTFRCGCRRNSVYLGRIRNMCGTLLKMNRRCNRLASLTKGSIGTRLKVTISIAPRWTCSSASGHYQPVIGCMYELRSDWHRTHSRPSGYTNRGCDIVRSTIPSCKPPWYFNEVQR